MGAPQIPKAVTGEIDRAADENKARNAIRQIYNGSFLKNGVVGPQGITTSDRKFFPPSIVAEITGFDCANPWRHSWKQVANDPNDVDNFVQLGKTGDNLQSGDFARWYAISTDLFEYITPGTIVILRPYFDVTNEITWIMEFVNKGFWAEITGEGSGSECAAGDYSFKEMEADGSGGLQEKTGGIVGTDAANEVNSEQCIASGTIVWMLYSETIDCGGADTKRYLFEFVPHLDEWFEIDTSPGNTGPVYTGALLEHDGAGDLAPVDPPETSDFLREVNGNLDLNLGSNLIVRAIFLGLSDDGDEGTCTKRYGFVSGGTGAGGCTDVWKTIVPDTGDTLVAVGCNDTIRIEGTGGITITGTIGAEPPPDKITIDGSGIAGNPSFWARIDTPVVAGTNDWNYTKLNDDLTVTVDTGTATDVNGNFLINLNGSGSSTRPIVRMFTDANGNNEHFEYQMIIKVRLVTNAGSGTYTFQAVSVLGVDITGYTGTVLEINKHLFLPTDATLGSGNGLRVLVELPEVGSIPEFTMPTARRQFWAELGARNCTFTSGDVYAITPKRETTGATLATDAQNTQATIAREVNGNQGADRMMASGSLVLVTELIDPNNALDPEFKYYFDADITASWYEITANLGGGTYEAKLLGLDLSAVQTCAPADITNGLTEKNAHEFVPIGSIVRATHDKIYSSVIAFSWLEKAAAEFGTVTNDGGIAGDAANNCTFVYEISDEKGTVVASTVPPEHSRLVNTPYLAAGTGGRSAKCYYSVQGGTVSLMHLPGEIGDNTPCP